jgi:glutathione synthase/RimK-type ligase-like ATP-grasp enzyme
MKIAIHDSPNGFHPRWRAYCEEQGIPYKRVNCHASDIIAQVADCDGLMWHHSQGNPRDLIAAKPILSALEHAGVPVFPDWRTGWHFDDKVAQKYLFEAIGAPLVPTWVFLDRQSALEWIETTDFPKVFKLRGGAGSANVRLARSRAEARRLVSQAFGRGFPNYDAWGSLKERWRRFRLGQTGPGEVAKGIARFIHPPEFASILGRERGYAYFQEFISNLDCDFRTIVINGRCIAVKRQVRDRDFRASGSGKLVHDKKYFEDDLIKMSFRIAKNLSSKSAAFDFVKSSAGWMLIEISYAFPHCGFTEDCDGYWDLDLNWYPGLVSPSNWMVEDFYRILEEQPPLP